MFSFTLLVRGMMYYRKALEIQYLQDTKDPGKVNVFIFSVSNLCLSLYVLIPHSVWQLNLGETDQ